jgi:hypothetical protein
LATVGGMTKAQVGLVLIAAGVVGAVATWLARSAAVDDHEKDALADRYTEAILGREVPAETFADAPYIALGAVCVVVVLAGVILYATQSLRDTTK